MEFLNNYINLVILAICLGVGFILKSVIKTDKINDYIPLVVGVLGIVLSAWISHTFTPDVIAVGITSGLASTGLYELYKNFIKNFKKG